MQGAREAQKERKCWEVSSRVLAQRRGEGWGIFGGPASTRAGIGIGWVDGVEPVPPGGRNVDGVEGVPPWGKNHFGLARRAGRCEDVRIGTMAREME